MKFHVMKYDYSTGQPDLNVNPPRLKELVAAIAMAQERILSENDILLLLNRIPTECQTNIEISIRRAFGTESCLTITLQSLIQQNQSQE